MKNQIFNLIKVTALAAILAAGVSAVSAFTGPSTLPPPGGPASPVSIPVNVSSDAQKKIGGFISELFLKSGVANAFTLTGANAKGWIIAEDTLVSPWSFSIKTFLPGTESQMKIGSNSSGLTQFTDATFPLTIDLAGRGTAPSPKGRDAIELLANTNYCNTQTTVRTNTPGVQFWSTKNGSTGDNADLIARQVQLNGGNPGKDKVLISVDAAGNATWAEVKVTNGVISYINYDTVPDVKKGQDICGTNQSTNDIVLPTKVTVVGSLATNTITETYQLGLLSPDPTAFVGATINQSSITDSSSLLFQYPSTMVGTSVASITIDSNGLISIKRNVPSNPSHTALTDVVNTSFSIFIPNLGKTYTISIKDTNTTGQITNYWSYQNIYSNSSHVINTNGTTHSVNMPDYALLSITKTP